MRVPKPFFLPVWFSFMASCSYMGRNLKTPKTFRELRCAGSPLGRSCSGGSDVQVPRYGPAPGPHPPTPIPFSSKQRAPTLRARALVSSKVERAPEGPPPQAPARGAKRPGPLLERGTQRSGERGHWPKSWTWAGPSVWPEPLVPWGPPPSTLGTTP